MDIEAMAAATLSRVDTNVPAIVHVDSAEAVDEELLTRGNAPAFYLLVERVATQPKSIGNKSQVQTLRFKAGLVTQNLGSRSAAMTGAKGSYQVRQAVMRQLHWWTPPGALRPLKFLGEEFAGRAGSRLLYEQTYETSIEETFV